MKRLELIRRVRSLTRDFSNSIFREQDIIDFINEGVNRFKQVIPVFKSVELLLSQQQEVILIPEEYQHLLAIYSASRCYGQDERHYQATTLMNEFEYKIEDLSSKIDSGDVVIINPETGMDMKKEMDKDSEASYVDLEPYWGKNKTTLLGEGGE